MTETIPPDLAKIVEAYPGQVSFVGTNLKTGKTLASQPDLPVRTASVIKVAIMVETFAQVAEGKLTWDMPVTLNKAAAVGGSGILQDLSDGLTLSLRDCVVLMIIVSDNTATNLVLDTLIGGPGAVNARMISIGFPQTTAFRKAFSPNDPNDPIGQKFGLGRTTAQETAELLTCLDQGTIVSTAASAEMIAILKRQQDKDGIARLLPETVITATKSGRLSDVRNDVGLLYPDDDSGTQVIAIFCDGQPPSSTYLPEDIGLETIAHLSRTLSASLSQEN